MEIDLRPQQTQPFFEQTVIQNGDTRDYKNLPPGRRVGDLHRFRGRILPHTYKRSVQEVPEVSYPGHNLSIQSTTLWSIHSPNGVYDSGQRGQITGNATGYKNPPVPRRLVGQSKIPPNLSPTYTDPSIPLSRVGLTAMSAKMRISLVSWIVSIEIDPRAGGVYPLGTCPWSYTRLLLNL